MELVLDKQELLNLGDDPRQVSIYCRTGCCWLTQAGDSRDHILHSGQSFAVTRPGKLLVMASAKTRLELLVGSAPKKNLFPWRQLCNIR